MPSGAKFCRESTPMPCVRVSFLEIFYLTCCVFFSPFFTISGESSRQVTQMEERKSGRGPRKATPRSRRIFTGFLNSFTRLFLYVPITIVPGPSSTSEAPVPPPAPAAKRFYNALASVYLCFRLLSSAFILESGVDGKAS